jgi:nitroreductase
MEAIDAILTRRSVREFSDKKIPRKILDKVLEAGIHAPSSKNSQPWYFVVDTTEKKNKIADLIEARANEEFTAMDPRTGKPSNLSTAVASARILREAPAVILIFSTSPFTGGMKQVLDNPEMKYLLSFSSEVQSIAAAAQNMLLAAHSLGLGALWNCDIYYVAEEIKELYNKEHDFMLAICLGYPKKKVDFQIKRHKKYEFV